MADIEFQTLARSLNELLILATVRDGPKHGYQIALEIEEQSDGYFSFKHGTLYPILHRLEKEGYIDGAWGSGRAPRRRKEYRLLDEGRSYLDGLIAEWSELGVRISDFVAGEAPVPRRASSAEP